MKTIAFKNRLLCIVVGASVAATLLVAMAGSLTQVNSDRRASVVAGHAVQVADGSESNGGKGGKGGAKRSYIA